MELDFPVEVLEPLLFLLSRMTDALLERVSRRRVPSPRCGSCSISTAASSMSASSGQHCRCRTSRRCSSCCNSIWRRIRRARRLSVWNCTRSQPRHTAHNMACFCRKRRSRDRLEVMLARLRKLLGEERVGSPELKDDHRPNAFRMVPFAPPPPAKSEKPSLSVPTALRVCRPPQAVGVVLADNAPTRVFWDGQRYAVREIAGPWRVSGQWWSEANWCREEWDVRLDNGDCRAGLPHRLRSALSLLVCAGDV